MTLHPGSDRAVQEQEQLDLLGFDQWPSAFIALGAHGIVAKLRGGNDGEGGGDTGGGDTDDRKRR